MSNEILDIETALRLKNFHFRAKSRVTGFKSGIHKSSYTGISPDFLDHKEYNRGDDLKQIDWRLYGRHDRLYVKKFEDEVNTSWCVLVDSSMSMAYGEDNLNKLDYAKKMSATLAYLLLKQGDAVGLATFSGEKHEMIPPKASSKNIGAILKILGELNPFGSTEIEEPILKALEVYRTDATFILVSDLLTDLKSIEQSVKLIRNHRKQLTVFHILHPDEVEFNFNGSVEFEDMETTNKVIVDTNSIRNTYRKRILEFSETVKNICLENESNYVLSTTNLPIEQTLIQIADK